MTRLFVKFSCEMLRSIEYAFWKVSAVLWLLLTLNAFGSHGDEILGIFSMKAKSHYLMYSSLTMELARRGHNVQVYTVYSSNEKIPGYREIDISSCFQSSFDFDGVTFDFMFQRKNFFYYWNCFYGMYVLLSEYRHLRNCRPLVELVNASKKFDAVIVDPFDTDLFSFFAFKFNATLINIYPNSLPHFLGNRMGSPSNPSYKTSYGIQHPMNFWNKLINVALYVSTEIFVRFIALPLNNEIRDVLFGSDFPPIEEVLKNTSLILTNSHFTVSQPVPLVPGIVEIGGMQIKNSTRLPQVSIFVVS